MSLVRFLAFLALASLVHFLGVRALPSFSLLSDLFVVVVVFNSLRGNSLAGLAGGAAAGLVQDALAGGPYGLHGFADTFIGFTTARVSQRLILQKSSAVLLTVMLATVAQQAILFVLGLNLMPERAQPSPLWWAVKALSGGLVAFVLHSSRLAASGARERARRERAERLRIGR